MKKDNTQPSDNKSGIVLYRYLTWDAFVKTLDSWMLKATIPTNTNDLFEFLPAMHGDIGICDYTRRHLRGVGAFFSFSQKMSDCAMWGHYADQFRGVCMAFYIPDKSIVSEVQYDHKRVNIRNFNLSSDVDRINFVKQILTTKDISWEYEKEYRWLKEAHKADEAREGMLFYREPMKYFIGAILGARCPYSSGYTRALLKQYLAKHKVEDTPNMNVLEAVQESYPDNETFSISCIFWNDNLTEQDLRQISLIK